jgi:formate/nitrite transporter FocA (FNT family)
LSEVPQPEDIYRRTREEGERRLTRPLLELVSTAIAAGVDVVAGLVALAVVWQYVASQWDTQVGHLAGAIAFGIAFVFLVVGRGELFTENFLVPIAGLEHRNRMSWTALARLWLVSPVFNVLGGTVLVLILTVHDVLPQGAGGRLVELAGLTTEKDVVSLFFSAVFAGALMTAMTWFVEGAQQMMVRVVVAWISGALLLLASFDHVIVETLALVFGIRYGGDVAWSFVVWNFFLAAGGNMVGGIGLVTLNRLTQGSAPARRSAAD